MSNLSEAFLTGMLAYGPPALSLALLLGALGLPLPGTMFLLAAGAFAGQGVLNWSAAAPLALAGTVLGDSGGYLLGRYGGSLVLKRIEGNDSWRRAQDTFDRRGGLAILLTRFVLTPLAVPINLIAGSSRYTFWRFLTFDVIGELVWVALYGGLGYLFADSWEAINDLAGNLSGLLVGIAILGVGGYLAYRYWRGHPASTKVEVGNTTRS
jgi:membrane protein DedA with SNARE-associated domain